MANEIKINLSISVSKNGAKYERQESFSDDMTGDAWVSGVQQVGTGSEDIGDWASGANEDLGTFGWIYLKNCGTDKTLYVDFAHTAAALAGDDNICRLYGGESSILKSSAETGLFAILSSGTQTVEYAIVEL